MIVRSICVKIEHINSVLTYRSQTAVWRQSAAKHPLSFDRLPVEIRACFDHPIIPSKSSGLWLSGGLNANRKVNQYIYETFTEPP